MKNYLIHISKRLFFLCLCVAVLHVAKAEKIKVQSPDKRLSLTCFVEDGKAFYQVLYDDAVIIKASPLGLHTNEGIFMDKLILVQASHATTEKNYAQDRIKKSSISYAANTLHVTLQNEQSQQLSIQFQISNHDIGFRYELPIWGERRAVVVQKEETGYAFPEKTQLFLSEMMKPMTGFARTAPSYEGHYQIDVPVSTAKRNPYGYVFPGLFHVENDTWVLLSETGVSSLYCGSHLAQSDTNGLFTIAYPHMEENNGFGSTGAAISLPGVTPWRTITVGKSLQPIVETTIPFDLVEPLYEPSQQYQYGRASWSWLIWQDQSMNWDDQVAYIDLASAMKFEYILIDAHWDTQIGRERMQDLISYAKSKQVDVFLWYNSNGAANDAPQGPRNRMNTSVVRKKEMQWLQKAGVKGLKVDFFGGDKQETIRQYEDILSDANDHGLMIIFHGATLPRGWERMYPNFVGSEAVIASEMLIFSEHVRQQEARFATLHPFIRNTVGSMEFGGVLLNKHLNKGNTSGNERQTSNAFQLATTVLFQNPVQPFALTPNNLQEIPKSEIAFLQNVPTTWDETLLLDGYPGKYVVLARRHADRWYIGAINAESEVKHLTVKLPMLDGKTMHMIGDVSLTETFLKQVPIKDGELAIYVQPNGGVVIF